MLEGDEEGEFDNDDTNTLGHHSYSDERQTLYYMRLIEHDLPKFVAFRKPFEPPTATTPLIIRSLYYGGEEHPVEKKRCVVVAVDDLPLDTDAAIHRLKLIAGPRWSIDPPKDGGVRMNTVTSHGYIKIACEDFPTPAMNFKWASDALDSLIKAANDPDNSILDKVPLDTRHVDSRNKKKKNGLHRHTGKRPSIRHFPQEWLPLPGERLQRRVEANDSPGSTPIEPEVVQNNFFKDVLKRRRMALLAENAGDELLQPEGSVKKFEDEHPEAEDLVDEGSSSYGFEDLGNLEFLKDELKDLEGEMETLLDNLTAPDIQEPRKGKKDDKVAASKQKL
ncbi:mitochondrial ribosomal subunit protein-domain-containing protein [Flagelloscypha sp. PMI_526]|nr:mitochondrial ribosomal subunit protein-domain-containing protein [Flagelloscypha sp. PMI_526]